MSYSEFHSWQLFYLLEPWGFADREYRTSALLAQIYNSKVEKKSKLKKLTHWMRDMPGGVMKYLHKQIMQEAQPVLDLETPEGRKQATDSIIRNFEQMFGKRVIRKGKQQK